MSLPKGRLLIFIKNKKLYKGFIIINNIVNNKHPGGESMVLMLEVKKKEGDIHTPKALRNRIADKLDTISIDARKGMLYRRFSRGRGRTFAIVLELLTKPFSKMTSDDLINKIEDINEILEGMDITEENGWERHYLIMQPVIKKEISQ